MRGRRRRRLTDGGVKYHGVFRQFVERRRPNPWMAVTAEIVATKGIQRDQQDVWAWSGVGHGNVRRDTRARRGTLELCRRRRQEQCGSCQPNGEPATPMSSVQRCDQRTEECGNRDQGY